ncbi:hypothetical protein NOV72_03682 [Caballeronia novacaledonica]|uniref:Methyltransferase type 11 domain-containing protein n=1 Tax=Caballeronia novacaledonica TaxID=1544861 RepID=A0A2U3I8F5_9BURK|nr:class I SAM-dependent methyltransferase [Caballeronia novacaledonica]SPB16482.1 hypothetical protein NOV72_03682 [Caballeronia novacaledonica]
MHIEFLQKVCDINDWSDPRIDHIIRNELRSTPDYKRKQWEFAMIYLALEAKGKIHGRSRGIAFGAGRERLVFALANRVEHLLATDLYTADSTWVGARTNSPKDWLLSAAPFEVDTSRLDAAFMDMNAISAEPNSVDFCYSSCAFEHIGKEKQTFVDHLAAVKNILKDGGVYVLTTELHYGDTIASPHNFFFSLPDLLSIVEESGLSADPVFDVRPAKTALNRPSIDPATFGLPVVSQPVVTPLRHGRVFTSTMLVLTKRSKQNAVEVMGYDNTAEWLARQWDALNDELWSEWRTLNANAKVPATIVGHDEMIAPDEHDDVPAFHTSWMHFGDGPVQINVALAGSSLDRDLVCRVVERPANHEVDRRMCAETRMVSGIRNLQFEARRDKVYAVLGRGAIRSDSHITVSARKNASLHRSATAV